MQYDGCEEWFHAKCVALTVTFCVTLYLGYALIVNNYRYAYSVDCLVLAVAYKCSYIKGGPPVG